MEPNQTSTSAVPDWTLGWRLRRALAKEGISVQEMADHLDYSRGQISRYLNDKGEPPRRSVLVTWALRSGVPFEWLAYGVNDTGPSDPSVQAGTSFPCTTDELAARRSFRDVRFQQAVA